jgi:hypothetical protein
MVNPDISQKYKMGGTCQHTLARQKNIQKRCIQQSIGTMIEDYFDTKAATDALVIQNQLIQLTV